MSFSAKVKEEAFSQVSGRRHCAIAELAAIVSFCGVFEKDEKMLKNRGLLEGELGYSFKIVSENDFVVKKCFTLLEKTFNIKPVVSEKNGNGKKIYEIHLDNMLEETEVLEAVRHPVLCGKDPYDPVDDLIFQKECCKRAFVRGAFMAAGSIIDPEKSYHMEIVCPTMKKALQLKKLINSFWKKEEGMEAKIISRKKNSGRETYVVYLKEGNQISDMLNIMETYRCLMELENIRIKKEIANSVNRKLNCEMANMVKTISAAQEQKNDILYLDEQIGLDNLPEELSELAKLRLNDMEASLKELGERLNPPVGKSGVNHRMKKMKHLADSLRGKEQ